ncbi:MAG TPA: hypothetical protein VIW29_01760 [Polyangiaceae bacterium]
MVQVGGVTYRIERCSPHCYSVVRLLDDSVVGSFQTRPSLRVTSLSIEMATFRDVVRATMRAARTSAVMHAVPICVPSDEATQVSRRSPSSMPPATPALV